MVPAHHRSLIYALDRALETALASGAAPLVGALASRAFHFSGRASVSGDRALDLANADALGQALLVFMVVPWGITLLLFTLLHCSYPQDRARVAAIEAAAADERSDLLLPGLPPLTDAEACMAAARGGSGVLELHASALQCQARAERQALV